MPKRATQIVLSKKEREGLTQITRCHRSQQQAALRVRIVLAAALGHSNAQIARELDINVDTVRLWRDRWAGSLGGIARDRPTDVERGPAVTGCCASWSGPEV